MFVNDRSTLVACDDALPGRSKPMDFGETHHVFKRPLSLTPSPVHEHVLFGMGCYWGVERLFWSLPGTWRTMVGNAGGYTKNPTYEELCTGKTGHIEVVRVEFDPVIMSFPRLLGYFWENHDPTQGMRQGNDLGTQYRSAIFTSTEHQLDIASKSYDQFSKKLKENGYGPVTTQIAMAPEFYPAEAYHQQYLSKNPEGYCGLKGTGILCR